MVEKDWIWFRVQSTSEMSSGIENCCSIAIKIPVKLFYLEYPWKWNTWAKHVLSYQVLGWNYVELEYLEHAAASRVWKRRDSPGEGSDATSLAEHLHRGLRVPLLITVAVRSEWASRMERCPAAFTLTCSVWSCFVFQ